jgi:3-oxo-5-alpha-steroid 4-dehydrogenase 1
MMTFEHYKYFVWIWIAIAIIIFVVSLYITAPYGRHIKNTWGPLIDNKVGWIIMELFVLLILYSFILTGENQQSIANWVIIGLFSFHYFHRSFIFPFKLRTNGKKMPLSIIGMGLFLI